MSVELSQARDFFLASPYESLPWRAFHDNYRIRHNDDLVDLESAGRLILYLSLYSPDLTPIEEPFSILSAFKAYLRRHGHQLHQPEDPVETLLEANKSCYSREGI